MGDTDKHRTGILDAISDWLKLLGLIVLVAEALLTTVIIRTGKPDPYVLWGIGLLGLIVVGLFYDRYLQLRDFKGDRKLHTDMVSYDISPEKGIYFLVLSPPPSLNIDLNRIHWNQDKCFLRINDLKLSVTPALGQERSLDLRLSEDIYNKIKVTDPVEIILTDRKENRWEGRPFHLYKNQITIFPISTKSKILKDNEYQDE